MVIENANIQKCEEGIFVIGENIVIENQFINKCNVGVVITPVIQE